MISGATGMSVACRFWAFFTANIFRSSAELTSVERVELDDYLSDLSPERSKALIEELRGLLARGAERKSEPSRTIPDEAGA
jgi:hypothetical protein